MFSIRRVGTAGHEILADGTVIGWAADEPRAALIAGRRNWVEMEGGGARARRRARKTCGIRSADNQDRGQLPSPVAMAQRQARTFQRTYGKGQ